MRAIGGELGKMVTGTFLTSFAKHAATLVFGLLILNPNSAQGAPVDSSGPRVNGGAKTGHAAE
jgi:hypothetical protein